MSPAEDGFRRITIGEPELLAALAIPDGCPLDVPRLDALTKALVQVGVLIATDAPSRSTKWRSRRPREQALAPSSSLRCSSVSRVPWARHG